MQAARAAKARDPRYLQAMAAVDELKTQLAGGRGITRTGRAWLLLLLHQTRLPRPPAAGAAPLLELAKSRERQLVEEAKLLEAQLAMAESKVGMLAQARLVAGLACLDTAT
jgi:hypothetical protein